MYSGNCPVGVQNTGELNIRSNQFHLQLTPNLNQESPSLQSGNIQEALQKVFIEIIPRGILPALRVNNFWFKKTGILETNGGSVCMECSNQQISAMEQWYFEDFELYQVVEVLSACTAQDCFGLFCTTVVEALLFKIVYRAIQGKYVF